MNEVYEYQKKEAHNYDKRAQEGHWCGPDIVFGLAYEFINKNENLLDLGIGTGLSSVLFHKAGLKISGLDGSREILEVCKERKFVSDTRYHDMNQVPFPYEDTSFNHVICVGVLNLFQSLEPLMKEVFRLVNKQGTFSFTVEDSKSVDIEQYQHVSRGSGKTITMNKHSENYIKDLLDKIGFTMEKRVEFWPFDEKHRVFGIFAAYVVKKY